MGELMEEKSSRLVNVTYISGSELARYFDAKKMRTDCLRCGAKNWSLHDTNKALGTVAILVGPNGEVALDGTNGFISQVSLSCNNCGTMWTLSRGYVNKWLKENPATIENEDGEPDE